ncbi:MAG: hypothetical protein ACE5EC_04980 [Phycisphaerae bacterium]
MAELCGAASGLLAFSAMIFCGLYAGNRIETIVLRAVGGLIGGYVLGVLVGWIGTMVVRDNVDVDVDDDNTPEDEVPVETAS